MSKGFLVVAENSITGDYVACATALAHSLRLTQSGPRGLSVAVPRGQEMPPLDQTPFEHIIRFDPEGTNPEQWNAHTKWAVMMDSPYDETIMMDADMLVPTDLGHWWAMLGDRDLLMSTHARTFRGSLVDEEYNPFRAEFRGNQLPNVYTALIYFRKTEVTRTFAEHVGWVTRNWNDYRQACLSSRVHSIPTDDMTFACAVRDLQLQQDVTSATMDWFSFVHMKTRIQKIERPGEKEPVDGSWRDKINAWVKPDGSVVAGGYLQTYPFHYHERSFLTPSVVKLLGDGDV